MEMKHSEEYILVFLTFRGGTLRLRVTPSFQVNGKRLQNENNLASPQIFPFIILSKFQQTRNT